MTLGRTLLLSLCFWAALLQPGAAQAASYHMLLGTRLESFDHPPMLEAEGRRYVSLEVLGQLGLNHNASLKAGAGSEDDEVTRMVADDMQRFQLADHELQVSSGETLSVLVDGKPASAGETLDTGFGRYLAASTLSRLGLRLAYDPDQELPQLIGRVYKVNYDPRDESVTLASLTPMSLREELSPEKVKARNAAPEDARALKGSTAPAGRQPGGAQPELTTLIVDGAYFGSTDSMDLPGGGPVTRVGFKNVEGSGRSYLYLRQPRRTGFALASDSLVGFARIRFGNYFQLASYRQTSSGEISINVQLGAPAEHEVQVLSDPPRLVMDFEDVRFEEASQNIKVGVGHVESIRVGAPEPGRVRVVLDLSQRLDYRVLSKDNGARLFVQLLPPSDLPGLKPAQKRRGMAIMLDAGHGGSDPGAIGVISGSKEAANTLAISKMVEEQLEAMGYTVLQTRKDDRFVSLGQRGDYANYTLPYVFVSIHCNAMDNSPGHKGVMTFNYPFAGKEARALAASVQDAIISATGAEDKGVREADFFVLRETVMPAILIETGFMTNKQECELLASDAYRRKLAAGIARGIDAYVSSAR